MRAEKYVQLNGHTGAVYAVVPSEKPGQVFTAGSDGIVARWDVENGTSAGALARIPGPVFSLYFHAPGQTLWIGREDGSLHVIDSVRQQEIRFCKNHEKGLFSIVYGAGHIYTSGGDGSLALLDPGTAETRKRVTVSEGKLRGLFYDEPGNRLYTASADGMLREFSPDLHTLYRKWHAHEGSANAIARLPDGSLLSGGRDARLKRWGPETLPELLENIPAHNYAVYRIRTFPEAGIFITCSRDKTAKIWDIDTHEVLFRISRSTAGGHRNSVNDFYYDPSAKKLVTVGDDAAVMVWKLIEEKEPRAKNQEPRGK